MILGRQRQALKPARAVQSITDGINRARCSHCMLSEPIGHFPRGQFLPCIVKGCRRSGLVISTVRCNRFQPIPQSVNFQFIQQRVNRCRIPSNPNRIGRCKLEFDIVNESGQRAVQLDCV
ncbi:unannotated protein [freshwater metagenome]|uniref:Unannotated protein n=1 Tax=freshwater metagenome TaxID=449393 RepID=A0A6J6HY31_9ZZZZ